MAIFIYHIGLIIAILVYRREINFKELLLIKDKKLFLLAIIISFLSGVMLFFLWNTFKISIFDLPEKLVELSLSTGHQILFLLYFSLVHPILEEIYWRFILEFKDRLISLGEVLFSAYHFLVLIIFIRIEFAILCVITLILAARIWRYFRQVLKENLTIFVSHAVADFSIFLFFILLQKYSI